jgi:hypothetical protein
MDMPSKKEINTSDFNAIANQQITESADTTKADTNDTETPKQEKGSTSVNSSDNAATTVRNQNELSETVTIHPNLSAQEKLGRLQGVDKSEKEKEEKNAEIFKQKIAEDSFEYMFDSINERMDEYQTQTEQDKNSIMMLQGKDLAQPENSKLLLSILEHQNDTEIELLKAVSEFYKNYKEERQETIDEKLNSEDNNVIEQMKTLIKELQPLVQYVQLGKFKKLNSQLDEFLTLTRKPVFKKFLDKLQEDEQAK